MLRAVFLDDAQRVAVGVEEEAAGEAALVGGHGLAAELVVGEGGGRAVSAGVAEHPAVGVVLEGHAVALGQGEGLQGMAGAVGAAAVIAVGLGRLGGGAGDGQRALVAGQVAGGVVAVLPAPRRRGEVAQLADASAGVGEAEGPAQAVGDRAQAVAAGGGIGQGERVAVAVGDLVEPRLLARRRAGVGGEGVGQAVFLAQRPGSVGLAAQRREDAGGALEDAARRDAAPGQPEEVLAAGAVDPADLDGAALDPVEVQMVVEAVGPAEAERAVLRVAAVVGTLEHQRQPAAARDGQVALDMVEIAGDDVDRVAGGSQEGVPAIGLGGGVDHRRRRHHRLRRIDLRGEQEAERLGGDQRVAAAQAAADDRADIALGLVLRQVDGAVPTLGLAGRGVGDGLPRHRDRGAVGGVSLDLRLVRGHAGIHQAGPTADVGAGQRHQRDQGLVGVLQAAHGGDGVGADGLLPDVMLVGRAGPGGQAEGRPDLAARRGRVGRGGVDLDGVEQPALDVDGQAAGLHGERHVEQVSQLDVGLGQADVVAAAWVNAVELADQLAGVAGVAQVLEQRQVEELAQRGVIGRRAGGGGRGGVGFHRRQQLCRPLGQQPVRTLEGIGLQGVVAAGRQIVIHGLVGAMRVGVFRVACLARVVDAVGGQGRVAQRELHDQAVDSPQAEGPGGGRGVLRDPFQF